MQFQPDLRPYPDDFVAWATNLKFKRFHMVEVPGCFYYFEFNSGVQMPWHQPGNVYRSTFHLYPDQVLDSVNWRRLLAAHIRRIRFACLRQAYPRLVLGKREPALPSPQ